MFIVQAILALSALYCGGVWGWLCFLGIKHRRVLTPDQQTEMERQTFHLGLCLILALGFLGLIWK
jgi:hypothetical protein